MGRDMRDKAASGAGQGGMVSALAWGSWPMAGPSLELVTAPVHAQAMRERGAPDESRIKKARHEIIRVGLGIW